MNYINTIISVSLVLVAFIFYYFLSSLEIIKNYFIKKLGEEQGQIRIILFQRLTGILFFGSIPAFFLLYRNSSSTIESFLKIQFNLSSLAFIIIFVVTAFFLNYFAARSPENLAIYPQIRSKTWSLSLLILSGLSWMTYLFAYEFLFRGLLLFFCIEELGVV